MSDLYSKPLRMGEFFDRVVDDYDEVHTSHIDRGREFYVAIAEPVAPTVEPINVLSLGAGTGLDLVGVVERAPNAHLHCIDLAGKMLDKLRDRFASKNATVTTHLGSYLDFDYAPAGYDYVLAAATLHHLTDAEKADFYPKLVDAMAPDGKLIIGDYYVSSEESAVRLAEYQRGLDAGYDFRLGNYHIDIPTTKANEIDLLIRASFRNVDSIWESSNYSILVVTM